MSGPEDRHGAARERDIPKKIAKAGRRAVRKSASSIAISAWARAAVSDHTMDEVLPGKGRMARGPAGMKKLMRGALMWPFVVYRTGHRSLAIAMSVPPDTGAPGGAALPPVGTNDQSPAQEWPPARVAVTKAAPVLLGGYCAAAQPGNVRGHQRLGQGAAQMAILDHLAHRALFDLGMIKVSRCGAAPSPARPSLTVIRRIGCARVPRPATPPAGPASAPRASASA